MRVAVFGTGYVGLVTGACLADAGHHVMCVDVDEAKVARLSKGQIPIFEPGLSEIVTRNLALGTLEFTSDAAPAITHGDIIFLAVGTPPDDSGAADVKNVFSVVDSIGRNMTGHKIVVVKSTVPVGTCDLVDERLGSILATRGVAASFAVVSNPEFLKEGAAISDFQEPDRIIIGTGSAAARSAMAELYMPFNSSHDRIVFMDIRSAELTKYAANAMLATKISFINEMASLAERLGADIEEVRRGIGSDPRIGHHFIYPGLGYGGSCFPKDVQALARTCEEAGFDSPLLRAVEVVNQRQRQAMIDKIATHFGGIQGLAGKSIAVWGLAFKPGTDDMREAPSRTLIEALMDAGARIIAFDPAAMDEARRIYGQRDGLVFAEDKYAALDGTDALLICTEWQQFHVPDFEEMARRMRRRVLFDGRNIYDPVRMREDGWTYFSIGRPPAFAEPHSVDIIG